MSRGEDGGGSAGGWARRGEEAAPAAVPGGRASCRWIRVQRQKKHEGTLALARKRPAKEAWFQFPRVK